MTTLPTSHKLAEHLVAIVREDMAAEPDRFAACTSWRTLHDVVDANEYVIDAMADLGHDAEVDDEHCALYNEAERIAEAELWGPPTVYPTPADALKVADAAWCATVDARVAKRAARVLITANGERVTYAMWARVDGRHREVGRISVHRHDGGWVVA